MRSLRSRKGWDWTWPELETTLITPAWPTAYRLPVPSPALPRNVSAGRPVTSGSVVSITLGGDEPGVGWAGDNGGPVDSTAADCAGVASVLGVTGMAGVW